MLKISWLDAAAQLLSSAVGFFSAACGRSEGQDWK
jgi:hypothetical protein